MLPVTRFRLVNRFREANEALADFPKRDMSSWNQ